MSSLYGINFMRKTIVVLIVAMLGASACAFAGEKDKNSQELFIKTVYIHVVSCA